MEQMNIEDERPGIPHFEVLYQEQEIESLPWSYPELDDDLDIALGALGLERGSALDLGTGPGTQAMALARRGFDVTATDIVEAAIRLASEKARKEGLQITWKQDDILDTRLDQKFDIVFDRGLFHIIPPQRREDYVSIVGGLLNTGGYLFLKCFSRLQPGEEGPYRFTPEQIQEIFGRRFLVLSVEETIFQGTRNPPRLALFCAMRHLTMTRNISLPRFRRRSLRAAMASKGSAEQ